jgi:prepilin peptidase CpaA
MILVILLIFYLLGGMGGGDLKLVAGFGAFLGDGHILLGGPLFAALYGGLMAVVYLAARAVARRWKTVPPADLSGQENP